MLFIEKNVYLWRIFYLLTMNILDIIIIVICVYALYSGAKDGIVVQVCTILGILLGLHFGGVYCDSAAQMCGITGKYSSAWGYAIVVILSILAVSGVAYILRQVLKIAGLGIVDNILGAALSLCKYLLIMSFLFSIFEVANSAFDIISPKELSQSRLYDMVVSLTSYFTPAWEWTQAQIKSI